MTWLELKEIFLIQHRAKLLKNPERRIDSFNSIEKIFKKNLSNVIASPVELLSIDKNELLEIISKNKPSNKISGADKSVITSLYKILRNEIKTQEYVAIEKVKKQNEEWKVFLLIGIALVIGYIGYSYKSSQKPSRQETIDKQFSEYDGSHVNLTKYILDNINDPDSYDHVATNYWDMTNYLVVQTKYRAKNLMEVIVLNRIKAKVDLKGNIIEILESVP